MKVESRNLHLRFGNFTALNDLTFELSDEKIYGLLGRNGAGKTTLLSIMAAFRESSSGSIAINGEEPFENAKIMQQIAFMYDKDYSDESENAKSILEFAERYRPNFDMDYADYLIDRFKLDKKKSISKFSKGMQSAFNVIMGLVARTPITIFDEAYLGMDAPSRNIFYEELLEDQQNHPRIMILSTHFVSEMDYLFDEVVILHEGNMLLQEETDALLAKGATMTGHADIVDDVVQSKQQINVQYLGQTKAVTVYGELSDEETKMAVKQGLEVTPVSLQDLFIHLTKGTDEDESSV
ncbi:ABC transporter ATP-binding protein [Salicibibacter cibarius]|uniref:ABC transporter ATP-binding protein n=1 Tax=Salicibibacter cibarius TaxID=2743000 RepID=A0A7T6Z5C6_9BACI|nr:ABC transporter ATP-binding protein [Salicibibacter cibarius]QQK77108.1 ABC transporter ATP-binding protein [Salicibibacter cibarius]